MVKLKKPMVWKEEDGSQYKISYSEKLQIENLKATKYLATWQKRNFYAKIVLLLLFATLTSTVLFVLYRLDSVNFFSNVMYSLMYS